LKKFGELIFELRVKCGLSSLQIWLSGEFVW